MSRGILFSIPFVGGRPKCLRDEREGEKITLGRLNPGKHQKPSSIKSKLKKTETPVIKFTMPVPIAYPTSTIWHHISPQILRCSKMMEFPMYCMVLKYRRNPLHKQQTIKLVTFYRSRTISYPALSTHWRSFRTLFHTKI